MLASLAWATGADDHVSDGACLRATTPLAAAVMPSCEVMVGGERAVKPGGRVDVTLKLLQR